LPLDRLELRKDERMEDIFKNLIDETERSISFLGWNSARNTVSCGVAAIPFLPDI